MAQEGFMEIFRIEYRMIGREHGIKQSEEFDGPNQGHIARIKEEQQLLRQIEGKLGNR
jgi:hypothetical protein